MIGDVFMDLRGKRILVLAGAHQHTKLVKAAKSMGVYTVVTDYLDSSPAKAVCDKSYKIDIKDIDGIVDMCRREHIDGVIQGYIDPCQRPYREICTRLSLPCYGTEEQFYKMTDKHAFKKMCDEYGVDTIPEYSKNIFTDGLNDETVEYPVFVKPVDSRGSRGQAVCYNREDVKNNIENAEKESSNGDVLIEKYMGNKNEFQVTYFFVNGEANLLRTADRHLGDIKLGLEKVGICTVSPSEYTEKYLKTAHNKVVEMFKKIGIKNGPVFMQGFVDGDKFRFFDPGLRFPGGEYEEIYRTISGINIMNSMIEYSLTGSMGEISIPKDSVLLKGKRIALLFPTVRSGKIKKVHGYNKILNGSEGVLYINPKYYEGDTVEMALNVNQRYAEIGVVGDNTDDLRRKIKFIYDNLIVEDENGTDMMFGKLDPAEIGECIVSDKVRGEYLK